MSRRRSLHPLGRTLVALCLGVALLGVAGCGSDSNDDKSDKPLKVGLLAPITGPTAAEGKALTQGFDLAVAEINADGGVLGNKIEVVKGDDQSTPSVATTLTKRMLQRDRVNVLFGTITGDTSTAVAKMADQAEVPFFQVILGGINVCSPYVYKIGETPDQLLPSVLAETTKKYGKRVALVGSDYEFPHRYTDSAKKILAKLGAEVVAEEYAPLGTSEWSPVISKLNGARPDVILSAVVGGDAIAFLKQSQALGLLDKAQVTGVSLLQEYYPAMPTILNGRTGSLRYSDQLDNPENAKFVAAYRKRYSGDAPIAGVTANAYVGVKMLAEAVEKAGDTDPKAIAKAIGDVSLPSMFGPTPVKFDENNHYLNTHMYVNGIKPGGKYTIEKDVGVVTEPTRC